MDILALILAAAALVVFVIAALKRPFTTAEPLALGLALLSASWIAQATTITDHLVNW